MYLDLLAINFNSNNYPGAEEIAIEIINSDYLKTEYELLAYTYSFLGGISVKLSDYENALKYFQKAPKIIKKIKTEQARKTLEIKNLNDFSKMYAKQGNFEKALQYINEIFKTAPNLKKNKTFIYAILTVNKAAYELKLGEKVKSLNHLNEALKIGEEINNYAVQQSALLKLGQLYKKEKNDAKAKFFADKALVISEKINFKQLQALKLSAEVHTGKKSKEFYQKYIILQEKTERKKQKIKNQFARVRFETKKREKENTFLKQENLITKVKIKDEQNRSKITTLIAFVCLLGVLFIFFFYKNRQKTLAFKTNLEKAQAREQERQEIAISLHDKVVGDLRLIYERAIKSQVSNIAEPLSKIQSEIRNLSHKLGSVDFSDVSFKDQIINLVSDYYSPNLKIKLKNLNTIEWTLVESQIKRALYLVIRESIQNSKKHASASKILINFECNQKTLQLTIKDNGEGFDLKSKKIGMGLKNQKRRVKDLNGNFNLESILMSGTTTKVEIPLIA